MGDDDLVVMVSLPDVEGAQAQAVGIPLLVPCRLRHYSFYGAPPCASASALVNVKSLEMITLDSEQDNKTIPQPAQ